MAWIGIEATSEPAHIDWTAVAGWAIGLGIVGAYVAGVLLFGDEIANEIARALRPRLG